jgi:precorrin-2/cobalt-factor-2 C20-methyltransferase
MVSGNYNSGFPGNEGDKMEKGMLYGVGVGPGDPELMTLKAVRIIREADVIAFPAEKTAEGDPGFTSMAYRVASQAVPEIRNKKLLPLQFPMIRDREELAASHRKNADAVEKFLDEGNNVAFLTIGDVSLYSTYAYLRDIVKADGYVTAMVSGIPSFCAAAAALDISLADGIEPVRIAPGIEEAFSREKEENRNGTTVLMKSGQHLKNIRRALEESGSDVYMVENCGLPDEKKYSGIENLPEEAGYFSVVITKNNL